MRGQVQEKDPNPLNCLKWNNDGRRISVGDSKGYVTLFNVHGDLATPTEEDFDKVQSLIDL